MVKLEDCGVTTTRLACARERARGVVGVRAEARSTNSPIVGWTISSSGWQ
jgi:hypothetical protein